MSFFCYPAHHTHTVNNISPPPWLILTRYKCYCRNCHFIASKQINSTLVLDVVYRLYWWYLIYCLPHQKWEGRNVIPTSTGYLKPAGHIYRKRLNIYFYHESIYHHLEQYILSVPSGKTLNLYRLVSLRRSLWRLLSSGSAMFQFRLLFGWQLIGHHKINDISSLCLHCNKTGGGKREGKEGRCVCLCLSLWDGNHI